MKTFTALIKIRIGNSIKTLPVEVKAQNSIDAKWLLQAIYGFHALVTSPIQLAEEVQLNKPQTPDEQRLNSLQSNKTRATAALKAERDRQKKAKAIKNLALASTPNHPQ